MQKSSSEAVGGGRIIVYKSKEVAQGLYAWLDKEFLHANKREPVSIIACP